MLVASLAILALGQEFRGVRIKLHLDQYERPAMGGLREMAMGLAPFPYRRYGVFQQVVTARANVPYGSPVLNYEDERVGEIQWSAKAVEVPRGDAVMLETGGSIRQVWKIPGTKDRSSWVNVARRYFWVTTGGKLLRDSFQFSTPAGAWTMDALFLDDKIEVSLGTPEGESKSVLHPKEGTKAFDAAFEPLLKDGKQLKSRKAFMMLDPFTGTAKAFNANVVGRFSSNTPGLKGKGYVVRFTGPGMDYRTFVRDDGELIRVELPNNRWIEGSIPEEFGGGG